jgi:predicted MPP superfamily phosphohydrolase
MSWTRLLVFVCVAALVSSGLHYYVWARLVRDGMLPMPWSRVVTVAIVAFAVLLPVMLPVSRVLPRAVRMPVATVVYSWMGLLFLLFTGFVAGDLVRLGVTVVRLVRAAEVDPERRALLGKGIAAIVGIGAAAAAGWGIVQARGPVATKLVRIALPKLPASMKGLTIVQITDLHIGPTLGHDWLADVVKRVNDLRPDVIAITGDLVDGNVDELREHVAPLGDLKAKLGVFFVTGNHEYYSGPDAWIRELARLNVRVLRNERVELERDGVAIDLAGVDDYSSRGLAQGHGPDLPRALEGRDGSRALVLLAHQPRAFVEAAKLGVGLQLSGHTHGGQIWPWNWFVRLQQPYVAGLHREGDAQIYVSRGTGYWGPPMRVAAPAEITQLVLEPA